jgi:hypothetical protein
LLRVATKRSDVVLRPNHSKLLILESVIANSVVRILFGEAWERKEAYRINNTKGEGLKQTNNQIIEQTNKKRTNEQTNEQTNKKQTNTNKNRLN